MNKGKFHVLHENGQHVYVCALCGARFEGFAAKLSILAHVRGDCPAHDETPSVNSGFVARGPAHDIYHLNHPDAGYKEPDKHRRWRLGRNAERKRLIAYYKAFYRLERKAQKEDSLFDRFMNERFDAGGTYPKWAGKISPLQRLAHAYVTGLGWEAVKHAAYELAYDNAIRVKINEWITKTFSIDKLAALETEAFNRGDLCHLIVDVEDINVN